MSEVSAVGHVWNTIATLTDETVLGTGGLSSQPPQKKVRAILLRRDGKIALMQEEKTGLWALPGGRIESGEDEDAALRREIFEETGCSCDAIAPFGMVVENRYHADVTRVSYFFIVRTDSEESTPHFTEEEIALGTRLQWHPPEEALRLLQNSCADTPQKKFLQARDVAALAAYLKDR